MKHLSYIEDTYKGLVVFKGQLTLPDEQIDAFLNDGDKPFIENVKEHYNWAWAGVKLPLVDELIHHGYNLFYAKRYQEAIDLFTWALSVYPRNLNLYDSMGEIQQGSGNKQTALKYYLAGLDEVKNQERILDNKEYDQLIAGFKRRIKALDILKWN
jgi:tetratricopeptide (TPR) repeat protein